jgi:hypothetical protein
MRATSERLYGGHRNFQLQRRYGITTAQVNYLKSLSGGLCWICEERPGTHVDHDHVTGEVRGVTCFTCNLGLGNFRDRPELLDAAVAYLDPTLYERGAQPPQTLQPALATEDRKPLGRPLTVAEFHRRYKYGLEPAEREALIAAQDGLCGICREEPAEHVDHDHGTGEVRGMLCLRCNTGLGNFRDRADIVDRALTYLTDTYYEWRTA